MPANSKRTTMKNSLKKNPSSKPRRVRKKGLNYGTLEDRKMLTVSAGFAPVAGVLTVNILGANEVATVNVVNGNVVVNNNQVATGVSASSVRQIEILGQTTSAGQQVNLNGNFSGTGLTDVNISSVNQVTFGGAYDVSNDFTATLDGSGGGISDGTLGRLRVGGDTSITANSNPVVLNNTTNDFNNVDVTTTGTLQSVALGDINDLNFTNLVISGNLDVNAGGTVSDSIGTTISVNAAGTEAAFTAANVLLGGQTNDSTNFFGSSFDVTGAVELQEDSNIILGDVQADSLRLDSSGRIADGRDTNISVTGLAEFIAPAGVQIGDNGQDTFSSGTLNFQSSQQVSINSETSLNIVGNNTARSTSLRSQQSISDAANASINIQFQTQLTGQSVQLGDTTTDEFNSNSIFFFTTGRFDLTEDSDTLIIEERNFAQSARLVSAGDIADDNLSGIVVTNLAEFEAVNVDIGNVATDFFTAGSIRYNTTGQFRVTENDDTNLNGTSTAQNSIVTSVGNVSNDSSANVIVANNAAFRGNQINIGNQAGDNFQFGSLNFITPNVPIANAPAGFASVNISEDDTTQFGGNSTAGSPAGTTASGAAIAAIPGNVQINSAGSIIDGSNASVNVTGNLSLTAQGASDGSGIINIGDSGTSAAGVPFDSTINTASLTVNSTGNATIEEDSGIVLAGQSNVNSLTLVADGGNASILDSVTAQTNVRFNLNLNGSFVNLGVPAPGTDPTTAPDFLTFRTLTVNSPGNVNIAHNTATDPVNGAAINGFLLVNSSTADFLTLSSDGNIGDSSPAGSPVSTIAQSGAVFAGIDVIIGESSGDFFDIVDLNGPLGLGGVTGTSDVVVASRV